MKSFRDATWLLLLLFIFLSACGGGGGEGGGGAAGAGGAVSVTGQVFFTDGVSPVAGATITVSLVTDAQVSAARDAVRARYVDYNQRDANGEKQPLSVRGPSPVLNTQRDVGITTDANGQYRANITANGFPINVLVKVNYRTAGYPDVDTSIWKAVQEAGSLQMQAVNIPDPTQTEISVGAGGSAASTDGQVNLENLPGEVTRVFGQNFDPSQQANSFPGEFSELGQIPLNSSNFLWMEALDANGQPITDFSQAVTIRSLVPKSQWPDLEDIAPGTDRIEIPMYTYDEGTNFWNQDGTNGWLEDENRTVLPEDAQPVILDGTFTGDVYAAYNVTHFSWMNVDYPYVGPWNLSHLSASLRNNDCLYQALKLAETIFRGNWGNTAYGDVNKPGVNVNDEVPDGSAPELEASTLSDATFGQTTSIDFKDLIYLNSKLWDTCDTRKNETIFAMAVTILHETAHWKHDVKKFDGVYADETDVDGEAGLRIEDNLFGTSIWTTDGRLPLTGLRTGDNQTIGSELLVNLVNPAWWTQNEGNFTDAFWRNFWAGTGSNNGRDDVSPLNITLAATQAVYTLGGPVAVTVTYENTSASSIQVMNLDVLQGYPLYFTIQNQIGQALPFAGPKVKLGYAESDFVELAPGATLQKTFELGRTTGGDLHFNFTGGQVYTVTASYAGYFRLTGATSNSIDITISDGGSISGTVTDASTGAIIAGATVKALDGETVIGESATDAQGLYAIEGIPNGTYTVVARSNGYLRNTVENIVIANEGDVTRNFSLSPLLVAGELRVVLTWGETPYDLDSHLWLPSEVPYHIYFGRKGDGEECPFAELDVDDTNSDGPETITVTQRYESGQYVYAVHNFSTSPEITTSGAKVEVYDSSGLLVDFTIPTQGTGLWWHVFNMDGGTGAITEVNQIINTNPEPYADTDAGCNNITGH